MTDRGSPTVLPAADPVPPSAAGVTSYLRILRHGPAARPFAAAVIARLPISMAPLGTLLLVQHVRGSYGVAGLVTGAFALGTAAGTPIWGRLMDRFGQPKVVIPTSLASAGFLVALAISAALGGADGLLIALAAATGITFPAIGPAMRAAWRVALKDEGLRRAGYALDAVAVESIFIGGPLLLSLLLAVTPPVVPLLVTAGLLAGGGVAYSLTAAARTWRPAPHQPPTDGRPVGRFTASAVAAAGIPAVLGVTAMMSVGFGHLDTSIAATAREVLGDQARLGLLFAAIAGGSATGGLWYGAHRWAPGHEHRRLPISLGLFTLGLVPLSILLGAGDPHLWILLPLLFLAGLSIAPSLIMLQNLIDALAPTHRVNEAQAWLSAASTTGAATGTAIAGIVIDAAGVPWGFAGAAAAVAVTCLIALASQRTWRSFVAPTTGP
ncbi:MAG TPA: MFS transporter [Mycobacteriales bacterium]|jgi:MFS family permease